MESEFVALATVGKEAEWLRNLILDIPLWFKPITLISILCDSAATLAKAYSQMYNGMSRHLGVRHNMIRELIMNGCSIVGFNSYRVMGLEARSVLPYVTEHPDSDSGKREFKSLMKFSEFTLQSVWNLRNEDDSQLSLIKDTTKESDEHMVVAPDPFNEAKSIRALYELACENYSDIYTVRKYVTGEHMCMLLKLMDTDAIEVNESDELGFHGPYYRSRQGGIVRLFAHDHSKITVEWVFGVGIRMDMEQESVECNTKYHDKPCKLQWAIYRIDLKLISITINGNQLKAWGVWRNVITNDGYTDILGNNKDQGLMLLNVSFQCKNALTGVFLS
nr:zinc finger, CCHC-type [Tanacetum cinerariifolium]